MLLIPVLVPNLDFNSNSRKSPFSRVSPCSFLSLTLSHSPLLFTHEILSIFQIWFEFAFFQQIAKGRRWRSLCDYRQAVVSKGCYSKTPMQSGTISNFRFWWVGADQSLMVRSIWCCRSKTWLVLHPTINFFRAVLSPVRMCDQFWTLGYFCKSEHVFAQYVESMPTQSLTALGIK